LVQSVLFRSISFNVLVNTHWSLCVKAMHRPVSLALIFAWAAVVDGATALSKEQTDSWASGLLEHLQSHSITSHPLLQSMAGGIDYPDHEGCLKFFSLQVSRFARTTKAIAASTARTLADGSAKETLTKMGSEKTGKPHLDLWFGLLESLDVNANWIKLSRREGTSAEGFTQECDNVDAWMLEKANAGNLADKMAIIMAAEKILKDLTLTVMPGALSHVKLLSGDKSQDILSAATKDTTDVKATFVDVLTTNGAELDIEKIKVDLSHFQDLRAKFWDILHTRFETKYSGFRKPPFKFDPPESPRRVLENNERFKDL